MENLAKGLKGRDMNEEALNRWSEIDYQEYVDFKNLLCVEEETGFFDLATVNRTIF
jgi:hypothetical protein